MSANKQTIMSLTRQKADEETQSKLDKLLAFQSLANSMLNTVVTRIDSMERNLEVLTSDLHGQGTKLDQQEKRITELERKLQQAMDDVDQLENRHRQNNLRLLNLPEGEEKDDMTAYLVSILSEKWNLLMKKEDFERAHRVGIKKSDAKFPRTVVFKVHHYQKKVEILRAVGKAGPRVGDQTVRIVQDMSIQLRRKRSEFWPLIQQLRKLQINHQLRQATLHVWDGGHKMAFSSPEKAKEELRKSFSSII